MMRGLKWMALAGVAATSHFAFGQASPKYTLDVRDAPTPAVFAMMLDGTEVTVMRHFPIFATFKLTEKQVQLPPPDPQRGYGDYWPIGGWLKHFSTAMSVKGMVLGFEREGGAFYVSLDGKPNTVGYDFYKMPSPSEPDCWHTVFPKERNDGVLLPVDSDISTLRLAGLRWSDNLAQRKVILVVRTKSGDAFTRIARSGDHIGIQDWTLESVDPSSVRLTTPDGKLMRLEVSKSRTD